MIDVTHTRHDWIVLRANELFKAGRERKVAMATATDEWPKSAHGKLCAEITALRDQIELVKKHINQRSEYVIALKDGGSGDSADYYRWTGNAEGRRQLAEDLHWTVPHNPEDRTRPKPAEEKGNPSEFPNSSPSVVHIHHHDIEAHAASFNEGFEEAVRQLAEPAQATINSTLNVPAPVEPAEEETNAEGPAGTVCDETQKAYDEAVSLSYWLAKQLDEHVDDASDRAETLTDTVQRLIEHIRPDLGKTKIASPPVVPAPTEASVIGGAAIALRAALAVVDPHEAGPWEHAWLSVRDLEDCASRAEAIATTDTEWPSLDAVPAHVRTVRDKVGDEYRRVENGGWDFRSSEWQTIISPTADYDEFAPFVAVEEQDR